MSIFSRKKPVKLAKRAFEAATKLAFQNNWFGINDTINTDIAQQGEVLTGQAREMAKNEPMAVKYLALIANNVIGSRGITLHSQAHVMGDPRRQDEPAARAIEKAYKEFCKVADVTGRNTLNKLYRLMVKTEARDGAVLVVEHFDPNINKFGYGLQVIDTLRLARDKNHTPIKGEDAIVMGVEIDKKGKPIAYWLHPELVSNPLLGTVHKGEAVRHTADRVIHFYSQEFPEQVNGYSRMHAAMLRMNLVSRYQKSAGVASAVGAAKMGFFITEDGENSLGQLADEDDPVTGFSAEAVPGRIGALPPGVVDFKTFNPDYPHAMYADFIKEGKRDISTGLNVSYHGLSGDLEGVSFSSIRSGVLEEREQWLTLQDDFIQGPAERIFMNWLRQALLKGAITLDDGTVLKSAEIGRLSPHILRGRRWPWVDPLKDEQASEKAVNNFTQSPYEVAATKGVDLDEALDDMQRFQEGITRRNLKPMTALVGKPATPNKTQPVAESDEDKDEPVQNDGD